MDSTVTLVSGGPQQWILIPTTLRSELKQIFCKSPNSKDCNEGSNMENKVDIGSQWDLNKAWFNEIAPQMYNMTWLGRYVKCLFSLDKINFDTVTYDCRTLMII